MPHTRHNLAPIELFTGTRFTNYDHIKRAHVFGCPTFVLDPKLQDHKKLPKWTPRARRGQFLGFSKAHSSTVGLILNPVTGNISPQYHLVHDDLFATVPNAEGGVGFDLFQFNQSTWNWLVDVGHERHLDDTDNLRR